MQNRFAYFWLDINPRLSNILEQILCVSESFSQT